MVEIQNIQRDAPFEIINNVLQGEKIGNPFVQENNINFGDEILKSFNSNPSFIGQVDAESGEKNRFEQMKERSVTCAIWMQEIGIQCNDVIMICTHNQLESYVPFLASLYIGAVVNPVDEHMVKGNLEYYLRQTKPKMLFIDTKYFEATELTIQKIENAHRPKIVIFNDEMTYSEKLEFLSKENFQKIFSLETILYQYYNSININNFHCAKMLDMKQTVIKLFSPGTTDTPKNINIPRAALFAPPDQLAPYMNIHDIGLWFESLGFINGIFMTIQAIFFHVTVIKVKSKFNTKMACRLIEQYKVSWVFFETSMCHQLVNLQAFANHNCSSLKTFVISGSPIDPNIFQVLKLIMRPNISIIQTYSLTEAGIISYQRQSECLKWPEISDCHCGYVGRNVQLKIVSITTEKSLGPLAAGEIYCNSPYMVTDSNSITYDEQCNPWFKTGDFGFYDKNGKIFVTSRINQMFVYDHGLHTPTMIEKSLRRHPAVLEAVVVSVPFNLDDDHPMAFVVKFPGEEVTEEELRIWAEKELRYNDQLRAGVIFLSQLPCVPNGKIHRRLLQYWAQTYMYD